MIRPKNVDEKKQFFEDYKDYTVYEISLKTKIPVHIIRQWRIDADIKSDTEQAPFLRAHRKRKSVNIVKVNSQDVWDNEAWFREAYSKYGIKTIARIISRTIRTVEKRFKRYGIKTKSLEESVKSKNQYNNREWLVKSYFDDKLGIRKMASIAGVSVYTIYDWLINNDIYPRTRNCASAMKRWKIRNAERLAKIDNYNKIHGTSIQSLKEIPRFKQ